LPGDLFKKPSLQERINTVKSVVRFDVVAKALNLWRDGAAAPDCPHCQAKAELQACHDGNGYHCGACHSRGDMIDLVQAVKQGFTGDAVTWLELNCASSKAEQPELDL